MNSCLRTGRRRPSDPGAFDLPSLSAPLNGMPSRHGFTEGIQPTGEELAEAAASDRRDGCREDGPKSRAPHDNIAGLSETEIAEILKLKETHPAMGPAQIRAQLKRFRAWRLSVRAIARVLRKNGYRTEQRTAREEQALMRFEAPRRNALWMIDALSLRVHTERCYLHLVLDDFSRFIPGYRLSEQVTSEEAVTVLSEAIALHGKPERVLTDRGGQFLAIREETSFRRFLERELIDHSVSRPYHPQTIGKVESVNRAIQKELIYVREFGSVTEAREAIGAWIKYYNFQRAHMGIDGLVPADRYFGLHRRVLDEVQARSRKRAAARQLDAPLGGPVEEVGEALEVLRLMLIDGQIQLRFCGLQAVLGKEEGC
ncbi:MAG TPA: transposase [Chloroflexi bacterium]|nr:transposase [Chloroflexota bacterium]